MDCAFLLVYTLTPERAAVNFRMQTCAAAVGNTFPWVLRTFSH